jgi:hypothetical protein
LIARAMGDANPIFLHWSSDVPMPPVDQWYFLHGVTSSTLNFIETRRNAARDNVEERRFRLWIKHMEARFQCCDRPSIRHDA